MKKKKEYLKKHDTGLKGLMQQIISMVQDNEQVLIRGRSSAKLHLLHGCKSTLSKTCSTTLQEMDYSNVNEGGVTEHPLKFK